MRLLFQGGPWADRLLESNVTTPPASVAPAGEPHGVYRRTDHDFDESNVVYEWSPDVAASPAKTVASPAVRDDRSTKGHGPHRPLGDRAGRIDGVGVRFALEVVGAAGALALAIVTLFARDWMEVVFRIGPDHGGGALEWSVVFGLLAFSIALTFAARRQWRLRTAAA